MFKKLYLILLLISVNSVVSQVTNNRWKQHFSFNTIVDLVNFENQIYAATTNAVFIHDLDTNQNEIFSTIDGLSGNEISRLFVAEDENLIFVGYTDGLLEIINFETREVRALADIIIQLDLPQNNLKINNFFRNEDIVYISTDFGIVEYSLETNNFRQTFTFGDASNINLEAVNDVAIVNNSIFAALQNGEIKQAALTSNLTSSNSWNTIQNLTITDFENINNKLYGITSNSVTELNTTGSFINSRPNFSSNIKNASVNGNNLSILTTNFIYEYDENFVETAIELPTSLRNEINLAIVANENVYIATDVLGLNEVQNSNFDDLKRINPNGPSRNNVFRINAFDGDLWGIYGSYDRNFEITEAVNLGPSKFSNNNWTNFSAEDFPENTVLTHIIINPNNKEQVYISAYRSSVGLYEYRNSSLVNQFSFENSNLTTSLNSGGGTRTSVTNGAYDASGNLWVYNAETTEILKRFSRNPDDNSASFYPFSIDLTALNLRNSDLVGEDIVFDDAGNIFMGLRRNGIAGYQRTTGKLVTYSRAEGGDNFGVPVTALKMDLTDNLWFGSSLGIRVLQNPSRIFDGETDIIENIVFENDEGVAQELLFSISVTDIEVDAENNKWIATNGSGVFYVSADGQETFNVFTKANSPLPSDNINDITIDNVTGAIFIATENGLMEFSSTVIAAEENFDNFKIFPNPVRPEYGEVNVQMQGLTAGATVKITDVVGNLVYEIENPVINGRGSGAVTWDTRSFSGKKVASGVYLALITGKDGEQTKIGKLLIIR